MEFQNCPSFAYSKAAHGNYVLAIKNVDAHGVIDGGDYNPRSIHIEKAAASHDDDTIEVFFKLRDLNYPVQITHWPTIRRAINSKTFIIRL